MFVRIDALGRWCVELTEAALDDDEANNRARLGQYNEAGFRLAIDDFDTGHVNLRLLKRSLVTKLKLNHRFMDDISTDMDAVAVVRGLISFGHSLGLRVAADGVTNQAQLESLLAAGCTEAQGELFAKPLPAVAFQERF